jgi:sulfatase maturation enzyme AslB (radical SAM superfamily)
MSESPYVNQIEKNIRFADLYEDDYIKRLKFARNNNCNTIILTGDGEPIQNKTFLKNFAHWNSFLSNPFEWIELQTTGVLLDEEMLRFLRNTVGVNTISVSVSDLFDSENNCKIIGVPEKAKFNLDFLCKEIKRYDFNLRISLNMINTINDYTPEQIFERLKQLGANQVIFRKMYYSSTDNTEQDMWVLDNKCDESVFVHLKMFILNNGRRYGKLPFGAYRYSVQGISTVVDDDCMSTNDEEAENFKYLILRQDCKLYGKWEDEGSLIF